jgi:hypothetical protein
VESFNAEFACVLDYLNASEEVRQEATITVNRIAARRLANLLHTRARRSHLSCIRT